MESNEQKCFSPRKSIAYGHIDPATSASISVNTGVGPAVASNDHVGCIARHGAVTKHLFKRLAIDRIREE
ncbi:hypothetical protein [Rhizobium mulingense]|uniref:hypothetical protein n=1 Tax=Rhizobium mulingense TaxID=3031128 RepID=UPI002B495442|nr:hypothetical protein [Rhizobium sp. MJ21]